MNAAGNAEAPTPAGPSTQTPPGQDGLPEHTLIKRHPLLLLAGLAITYLATGKLALLLAIPPGYATAFFPPAGVAVAGLLIGGARLWPGIVLGSFLLNLWIAWDAQGALPPMAIAVALAIGGGAALQGLAGAFLARRFTGFPAPLDQGSQASRLLVLAGPIACLVNATLATAVLVMAGILGFSEAPFSAWTWWVGDTLGVLIGLPILLTFWGRPREIWRDRRISVTLPLILASAVVVLLFVRASDWEQQRIRLEFEGSAKHLSDTLIAHLSDYTQITGFIERFFVSSDHVDRNEFRKFVATAFTIYPGIQGLGWNPRVTRTGRSAFETAARQNGLADFQIRERNSEGKMIPAGDRPEYFPAFYLEPLDRNRRALGFDLGSNPARLTALIQARETGEAVATAPITLVQEQGSQHGFLLTQPIFSERELPDAETVQRGELTGYAVGVFRVGDMVEAALAGVDRQGIALSLIDLSVPDGGQVLATIDPLEEGQPLLKWGASMRMGGRQWRLAFAADRAYLAAHRNWGPWLVMAGGLTSVSMMGAFLLALTGRTSRIEALVAERTQALEKITANIGAANQALDAIREAQSDFITRKDRGALFNQLLEEILSLTDSAYGFIGEVLARPDGAPYLKTHAITNIAWSEETERFYQENAPQGLEFFNLETLFGAVLTTNKPVIANDPANDPRRGGLPEGHPPLNAFLGLPFFRGADMIGMVGLANRPGGYAECHSAQLQPFLATCASLIEALRTEKEREQSARELAESEARVRAILETAVEGIVTINADGLIQSANPAAGRLFGYAQEEMLGRNVSMLMPSPIRENHDGYLARYRATGEQRIIGASREVQGLRKDGSTISLDLSVSDIGFGLRRQFTGILHDLTERKRAERLKNEFVSTVSHELRTPLTSIYGGLKMAISGVAGPLPEKAQRLLEIAYNNSERLNYLINDILDIQRIESGRIQFDFRPVEIVALVKTCLLENKAYGDRHQVTFRLEAPDPAAPDGGELISPDAPGGRAEQPDGTIERPDGASEQPDGESERPDGASEQPDGESERPDGASEWPDGESEWMVRGDPARLAQVMANLLSNAAKFSNPGETVVVSVRGGEDSVRISVADRGLGIPEEFQPRLFEKFAQADASDHRQKGGTGLGLAITRSLVEGHGGSIDYETAAGVGTTFHVTLPLAGNSDPDQDADDPVST